VFLNSALAGGEWSASLPSRFALGEIAPGTYQIEVGWVWTTWRGDKSCPYRYSNSYPSAVEPVVIRYTDCVIPATVIIIIIIIIIAVKIILSCTSGRSRPWGLLSL
jgi:hypothetical protein